jgi:hypothetical protein
VTGTTKPGKTENATGTQGNSMNGSQSQHLQAEASQRSILETSGSETRVMQTVVGAVHSESRSLAGANDSPGAAQAATHPSNGADGDEQELSNGMQSAGMSGISATRLIQTMGSSEMRMGMHSNEFGNISIRTSISQQQVQAQISVEHIGLGNALSAHINSVQSKLGSDYGLNANIQLNQSGASSSGDRDGSQQHQSKPAGRPVQRSEAPMPLQSDPVIPVGALSAGSKHRLDIRA